MKTSAAAPSRRQVWQEWIVQQRQSGLSVQAFCVRNGVSAHSFYQWRKRLAINPPPVRFALVEAQQPRQTDRAGLELWLDSGERLRIGAGVDAATLRSVLAVLRERP